VFLEGSLRNLQEEIVSKGYLAAPILYIPVPQTGHLPFIAGLPFFIVTASAFGSSRFARHLTQYISAMGYSPPLSKPILARENSLDVGLGMRVSKER